MYTLTLSTSVSMMSFPSCAFRKPCIPGVPFLHLNTVSLPGVFWLEKWVGKKIGCHSKGFSTHLPKAWYFWSVYFLFCFAFFNFQWCLFYNKEGLLIPSVGLIWEAQFIGLQGVWGLTDSSTRDLLVVWGLPHWFSFPALSSIPQPVLPSPGWFPLTLKQPWVIDIHRLSTAHSWFKTEPLSSSFKFCLAFSLSPLPNTQTPVEGERLLGSTPSCKRASRKLMWTSQRQCVSVNRATRLRSPYHPATSSCPCGYMSEPLSGFLLV